MSAKPQNELPGTSRQSEEQHLAMTLNIVRDNMEKYGREAASLRQGIDDMQAHFHDDNPELINELENTYTMYNFMTKTLERHERAMKKPYFGRIDFHDETLNRQESFYIGRSGIARDVIHPVVIDWRSPAANTYYENGLGKCSYLAPDGKEIPIDLKLKRTYEIENGQLQNIFDTEVIANDDILTKYLSKNKQAVLGEIVATIQKEQNEIIRKTPYHNCLVQGVAGSGKTTVSMHRISFILYNYEERFRPEDFYIVGSNRILLNYITGVLPDLDVYGVRQMTMEQLFVRLLYEDWDEQKYQIKSTGSDPKNMIKGQLSWFRDLEAFCSRLESESISTESIYLNPKQFVEGIVDGKTGVHDRTGGKPADPRDLILLMDGSAVTRYIEQNPAVSIQSKINMLNERLKIRVRDEFLGKGVKYTEAERKVIAREYNGWYGSRVWKKSIFAMYQDFLLEQAQKGLETEIPDNTFDVYDLAALAYLYKRVKETEVISEAHHMVIDEAQDFGMMVYSTLKFCVKDCTYTIMGDVSQNIHFGYGLNDWEELKELYLTDERASFGILKKSYRNTVEISDFATRILHHGQFAVYPVEPIIRHGTNPVVTRCRSRKGMLKKTAETCSEWQKKGLETIAVICRNADDASQTSAELGQFIEVMESSLETAEFGNGIMVLPVEYTKGLEFDAVLILNPTREDYPVDDGHAKLLYVAATRALHELCVLHTGDLTGLIADPVPERTIQVIEEAPDAAVSHADRMEHLADLKDSGKSTQAVNGKHLNKIIPSKSEKALGKMTLPADNTTSNTSNSLEEASGYDKSAAWIKRKMELKEKRRLEGQTRNDSAAKMQTSAEKSDDTTKSTDNASGKTQPDISKNSGIASAKTCADSSPTSGAALRRFRTNTEMTTPAPSTFAAYPEIPFGTPPANELLRPLGHAIPDFKIRWMTKQPDALCLHSSYGVLRISPITSKIIRVTFAKGTAPHENTHRTITDQGVFRKWKYRESGKLLEIKTDDLYLQADKENGAITFMTGTKKVLLEERKRESRILETENRLLAKTSQGQSRTRLYLNWTKNENLYALGAGTKAELSLKGTARYISHKNSLNKLPMVVSDKGYGLAIAADGPVFCCNIPTYGPHICAEYAGELDYYFIAGKDTREIIAAYDALCGRK